MCPFHLWVPVCVCVCAWSPERYDRGCVLRMCGDQRVRLGRSAMTWRTPLHVFMLCAAVYLSPVGIHAITVQRTQQPEPQPVEVNTPNEFPNAPWTPRQGVGQCAHAPWHYVCVWVGGCCCVCAFV